MSKGIMSESMYKNGKLMKVERCLTESEITFEKFVANKVLMSLLRDTYEGVFFDRYFERVVSE